MKRQITVDTETTGMNEKSGDRVVEIGMVEMIDGKRTGNVFHKIINPQRNIPDEVIEIHGITNEMVKDKPIFADVVDEMIEFVSGAEVIIHNLKFDLPFLNEELSRVGKKKLHAYIANARCSLDLSRKIYPKIKKTKDETPEQEAQRKLGYSLDDMCDRLGVDRSARVNHGALLDSELLAEVYMKLMEKFPIAIIEEEVEQRSWNRPEIKKFNDIASQLSGVKVSSEDEKQHDEYLKIMQKESKVEPIFLKEKKSPLKM